MDFDIRDLLDSWPYHADDAAKNLRRARGHDGRPILQVREPLGIQQLEYEGRPDGAKPHGRASLLEHFQALGDTEPGFILSPEDCQSLIQEGILFYQRYLLLYQMSDWDGVARDTQRNLSYFDFLKRHADRDNWLMVEQYRPYVIRMNAIARSQIHWGEGEHERALAVLRRALKEIRQMEPVQTQVYEMESERSIKHIEQIIEEFEKRRPETLIERLRREQREAIDDEDFERAARLRDRIKELEVEQVGKP